MHKQSFNLADFIINSILLAIVVTMLLPMYNVVLISFATPAAIASQPIYLLPTSFDFSTYSYIFSGSQVWRSLGVSFFVTIVGTFLNIAFTTAGAYALTKKQMPGRSAFLYAIIFSMIFSGGLIPLYLTIKNLHLINSVFSMILPLLVNTYYLIIMMTFFRTIPDALEESARIDGANDIQILFKVVLPISMPTVAAITLFYAVDRWNEWWSALMYINESSKFPMQLYLREMLIDINQIMTNSFAENAMSRTRDIYPQGAKMATVVITTIPILLVYPFLQRYFSAGVMVGSIKE